MSRLVVRFIDPWKTQDLKSRVHHVCCCSGLSLTVLKRTRSSNMPGRCRVAIVGAGAAGLCAARHLLARPQTFASPTIYEQSNHIGGTWFYDDNCENHGSTTHHVHSSMYRDLRTNLPKEVMMFPDFPFEAGLPSFLPHQDVQSYLEKYCNFFSIKHHIKFNTTVEAVRPIARKADLQHPSLWEVTSCDENGSHSTETFDSVFICAGHYSTPYIPSIPGLDYFKGKVMHSHFYRYPEPFTGKTIIVFGAGPSGLDISIELAQANAQVVLSHGKPTFTFPLPPGIHQSPALARVMEDGSVQFTDDSQAQADVLMFCTGYKFSFPFLCHEQLHLDIRDHLIAPLYRFILPPAFPSLFFIGICKTICPFPHFHCQVQFALSVLDGTMTLPSQEEMQTEVQAMMSRKLAVGIPERHFLKMESEQWTYHQSLAEIGKFPPLPPVIQSLYEEVSRQRKKHPQNYRNLNYRLLTDTQWEAEEKIS